MTQQISGAWVNVGVGPLTLQVGSMDPHAAVTVIVSSSQPAPTDQGSILRAGVNLADNPIPDAYVNPLFPATVKSHYTLGAGWAFTPAHELNLSYTYAPRVSVTSGQGVLITHKQQNVQLMYTARF